METDPGFIAAVEEARQGQAEGGVPIGACLVSKDGDILGRGHNMRFQKGSATLHVSLPLGSVDNYQYLIYYGMYRAKYPPLRTQAVFRRLRTKVLPCTRPCRPATCARVPVSCIR